MSHGDTAPARPAIGAMISDMELQALVARYGAVNVENVMILCLLATDQRGQAVSLRPNAARVQDILAALFRGTRGESK